MSEAAKEITALQSRLQNLQREYEELQQFSHILSHDLRAPIKNINNLAAMIALDKQSQLSAQASGFLSKLQSQSQNLHRLINDLREISKQNLNNLALEQTNTNAILDQIIEQYQNELTQMQAQIHRQSLPNIFANPQLIWQLLDNLLRNAIKHGQAPLIIEIHATPIAKGTQFTFANNVQNSTQIEGNIFSFSHDHEPKNTSTGLGLFICKKIVHIHGGEITANLQGEKFEITFSIEEFINA